MHGLNLGFALALGLFAGLSKLDLGRFARFEKLQLVSFSYARAEQLRWQLILPHSLRVLHMDRPDDSTFVVSPSLSTNNDSIPT